VPWLIEAATALYGKARVADRIPQVANVVISNVPGPPVPLYMAGAKMLTNYPTSIVVHGMALNITVQSYDQSLDFGLMADARTMPRPSRKTMPTPEPTGGDDTGRHLTPPGLGLVLLEARAPWEAMAMAAVFPWLSRMPSGDGHAVLVFPGLGASDISTLALRRFLKQHGYQAHGWKQGLNLGPRDGVLDASRERVHQLHAAGAAARSA
jgi:hypothetical protein